MMSYVSIALTDFDMFIQAREIMQLFTTGLIKLNLDGTPVLDDEGQTVLAYTNDEIMSFARVWTGFDYQQG